MNEIVQEFCRVPELSPGFLVISNHFLCGSWLSNCKTSGGGGKVKIRELVTKIERDGWKRVFSKGGHLQYKHSSKKGRVTVSGHAHDDVHPKTLRSILKQAGLK